MEFWTIEVADGPIVSAARWRDAHGAHLVEAAVTHGAQEWTWVARGWGVLFEVAFHAGTDWLRFRGTAAVRAALDAVPDPEDGLLIYSGRGGSSGAPVPRPPRRPLGAGAAAIPVPSPEPLRPPPGLQQPTFDCVSA